MLSGEVAQWRRGYTLEGVAGKGSDSPSGRASTVNRWWFVVLDSDMVSKNNFNRYFNIYKI
jgi:hypothetical protein